MPRLFLFALLLALLSGCVVPVGGAAPATTPTTSPDITPTSPTSTEVAPTPTITPTETEIVPVEAPKIDPTPASYPLGSLVGAVQESFERGDYDPAMADLQKWVDIWAEMGIFQKQEVGQLGNSLNFDPLDGRAKIGCVDTKGVGPYAGQWLCQPLDLVNGGLRALPTGSWDRNADGPLFITLDSTEELKTKGTGTDMAYQVINRYFKTSLRYIDPKTGQYVEGEYQVPGGEIKLPAIVLESMNQIPDFTFNMEFIDPDAAYRMLLKTVVEGNLHNENFWRQTLGTATPTVDQLLAFARNNVGGPEDKAYWLPFETAGGTRFNFLAVRGNISDLRSTKPQADGAYLDGMYSMFVYGEDLKDPAKADLIRKLKSDNKNIYLMSLIGSINGSPIAEEFGLLLINNRFIYVSGNEGVNDGPFAENFIGGVGNNFRPDRDPAVVSAQFLSYLKAMASYRGDNTGIGQLCTWSSDFCPGVVHPEDLSAEDWVVKAK